MFKREIVKLQSNYLSRRLIFVADVFFAVLASAMVMLVVNLISSSQNYAGRFLLIYLIVSALAAVALIRITGCYKIIIRHIGIKDFVPFGVVGFGKALVAGAVVAIFGLTTQYLWVIVLADFLITFVLMIGIRIMMVLAYEFIGTRNRISARQTKVLIYGISEKSVAAVTRLQLSRHYQIKGFIVRGREVRGTIIDQLPVYCFENDAQLEDIFEESGANCVLFAKTDEAQSEETHLISFCNQNEYKTLIIPDVDEVREGQSILRPREIKVEDLLGRDEIKINMDAIRENFSNKVVLVTGAAGSIGSELVRQLAGFGVKQLVLFDNAETPMHNIRLELEDKFPHLDFVPVIGDVRQVERLDFAFRHYRPQVVFHAAAYKHVPLMEENPCEAVRVNVIGSRQVADKCIEYDVEKMVMISTDKAVNPTNIMGCTKRLAEIYVQSLGLAIENGLKKGRTVFVTTRFGNVLGSNGSVIPRFRAQIAAGGPVTVTHKDINRFFMTIPEACRLVMEAATMATATQIFVFDMGKPVKIADLARRMITLAGFVPDRDIKVEFTGLRPGEKLYEEVLSNTENTLPTVHERIRIAKVRSYDYANALHVVEELDTLSAAVYIVEMVRLMKLTVPEYKSTANSEFAKIDAEIAEGKIEA